MNNTFELVSKYTPSGDQPQAIKELVDGINEGKKEQVLLGNNSFNSEYNWPAKVLLWANTKVGLFVSLITLAIVNVLPVPVAPNKTCSFLPSFIPSTNSLIACG